jgi:hypothetical protein
VKDKKNKPDSLAPNIMMVAGSGAMAESEKPKKKAKKPGKDPHKFDKDKAGSRKSKSVENDGSDNKSADASNQDGKSESSKKNAKAKQKSNEINNMLLANPAPKKQRTFTKSDSTKTNAYVEETCIESPRFGEDNTASKMLSIDSPIKVAPELKKKNTEVHMPMMDKVRRFEQQANNRSGGVLQMKDQPHNFLASYKKNIMLECKHWYDFKP